MSEEATRFRPYEYRSNQTVVLQAIHRRHRTTQEGAGDPESLVGRITHRMGDMHRDVLSADRIKAAKVAEKKRKRSVDSSSDLAGPRSKRIRIDGPSSVLSSDVLEGIIYQPKKRETRQAYQELLHFVERQLGDQQLSVVMSAADEVLALLKDQNIRPAHRQRDIQLILGNLTPDKFNELSRIGKAITDYSDESAQAATQIMEDEDAGVSVLIGGESDDDEYLDDAEDEDEDEDENAEDTGPIFKDSINQNSTDDSSTQANEQFIEFGTNPNYKAVKAESDAMEVDDVKRSTSSDYIDPREIDAYWLQRAVNEHFKDADTSAKLAAQILPVLGKPDSRAVENDLLEILDYDKFDFVKVLMHNRISIYYATRLLQAQTEAEKAKIEEEMARDPQASSVLRQLRSSKSNNAAVKYEDHLKKEVVMERTNEGAVPYAYEHRANTTLDLEAIAFQSGSHLMTNKKCVLPPGSKRFTLKEYEEVLIPATKAPTNTTQERFPISEFPEWAQKAFPGVETLNPVQTKLKPAAFETSENLLLCAPTGAGKTNVAMMCMLHEIGLNLDPSTGQVNLDAFKIIYVAPMKSLVQEMVHNFGERLKPFGINVKELSGDSSLTKAQINETQVIITTPEKWDIITRKSGDRTFTEFVKLVIIDEIHLLHDERGPVLESIVARTVRQIESTQSLIRLVGLSATLPNYEDVATFLRVKPEYLFAFKNHHRPIPLEQSYIGITTKKPFKRFQIMNEVCYEKMMSMAGEQMLIFVHSRKETAKTAKTLRDMAIEKGTLAQLVRENDLITREILTEAAATAKNADLKDLLPYGFAVHHAGMTASDRALVEDLFADRRVQVLVSTATLAWGVNLPAHAVIIKGTQIYNPEKGDWMELSSMDVMQMLGRAGRPQYDTKGVGIVITTHQELQFYLSLLNHQLPIESQYISRLADNLNAEIVLGTVQTMKDAVEWLGYTYLYVCMLRNPGLYGISAEMVEQDPYLEQRRVDLVHTVATTLAKNGLIRYERKTGQFQSTDLGRISSHYYIPYQSIATYNEHLKPSTGDIELLRIFSLSKEFTHVSVRQDERLELEKLIDRVPVPVKESIDEPSAKINVLLQAYISQLKMEGFSLMSDMVYVTQSASRIMRCLFEISLRKGWSQLAERCLNYCKMIDKRIWLSQSPLRQFSKTIPEEAIRKLETKELTLERLYTLNSREIGDMIRYPNLGKPIHQAVHQFPKLDISPTVQPLTRSILQVELTITPDFEYVDSIHGPSQPFWIFVVDVDGENILHYEFFTLKKKYCDQEHFISFTVPMFEIPPPQYFIKVISDRWIGFETVKPISFRHLIPPDRFPEPRALLDLQPATLENIPSDEFKMAMLPILRSDMVQLPIVNQTTIKQIADANQDNCSQLLLTIQPEQLTQLEPSSAKFNHIQTQVFHSVFNSDANVLLAAPASSGKTLVAELAICRELSKPQPGNIVYICGAVEQLPALLSSFKARYPQRIISELTGEAAIDVKLLDKSDWILATAQQWDSLSRRWKQRAAVQRVSLFIIDELQLIGRADANGTAIEVIVSRMRYMSKHLKMQVKDKEELRFVGLSASIANSNNFADWLGISSSNCFNFHPQVRPVPIEITLQGYDNPEQSALMLSMSKPLMYAVSRYAESEPVLIFVPSRKISRTIAVDLITHVQAENWAQRFLHMTADELSVVLSAIDNKALKQSISFGIGFINESLLDREIALVKNLYRLGKIQVLIATRTYCWNLDCRSKFVAIVGTQYYEGKEHRYVDYGIHELLQMMGYAGRQSVLGASTSRTSAPLYDTSSRCIIMCHLKRREFYKKFISDPIPVESHLESFLHDHLNAEIYTKVIENKQETLDYLTWTFYYRRLAQNPNYYGLQGISHTHLSDKLSELMDETLTDLEQAKCIAIEDETDISILNAGMISAFYYIRYTTIELLNFSLTEKTKMRGLIEILSNASEFEELPIRHKEDRLLKKMAMHLPVKIDKPDYYSAATKVNILLQSHFSRQELPIDLMEDQKQVLVRLPELLQAAVDIISSSGWYAPAIAAMELCQMIVQAVWDSESVFRQLPHFTPDVIARLAKEEPECETIFDLLSLDDDRRNSILQLSKREMADVARVCNRFPNIDVNYEVDNETVPAGEQVTVRVKLDRELDEGETTVGPVHAPFFPKKKVENWWLLVGDSKRNTMLVVKRIPLANASQTVKLDFIAPEAVGTHQLTLSLISDSWIGCDQEYDIELNVTEAQDDQNDDMEE